MHQRSVVRVGASLIVASLALTACGRPWRRRGAGAADGNKIVKIGVMAPLSGDLSALGLGIQHSVELAVKQANDSKAIPGWKLEVEAKDDEAKPDVGKNAATAFAGDADVIGVVGNAELQRCSEHPAGARRRQDRPGLAGQHQPDADPGCQLPDGAATDVRHLLPHLHDGRRPGSVRRALPVREGRYHEGRHDPRQEGLRPGPGRARSPRSSRSWAAPSSRPRPSTPTTRTTRPSSPR